MSFIDIVISVFLLFGMVRGFLKGFIYEIAVLGSLFLGYYLGFKFANAVAPSVQKVIHVDGGTLHYVSVLVIWVAVSVGIFFLAKLFEGLVNIAALGIFNKIGGAIFGLLKFFLIVGIVVYFFNKPDTKYHWIDPDKKAASKLYYPILHLVEGVVGLRR